MIAIDVEFLTGRYVATRFNDRGQTEWPPHPARLFSALVATASEHDELAGPWRRALEWLEAQGAPHVLASEASARAVVEMYVPENRGGVLGDWSADERKVGTAIEALAQAEAGGDARAVSRARREMTKARERLAARLETVAADDGKHNASACATARGLLPERRGKQPRAIPSVTPDQPWVRYLWVEASPEAPVRDALAGLARCVVRLGHSSTLVACRFVHEPAATELPPGVVAWIPSADGPETLRTVGPGQLESLERAYARHEGVEPRVLPAHYQPYRRLAGEARREPARPVFGEWLVLREVAPQGARRLGLKLTRTEDLARALRGALLHHAEDPPPAALSGHAPNGDPLERPHVAFLALADVGSRYADGTILGAAVVLPRDIEDGDRRAVLQAMGRWERAGLRLTLGRAGALVLERVVDRDPRSTLEPNTWVRPARRWATVTPVALDENPGDLSSRDPGVAAQAAARAEELVARACERIGLPRPVWVQVMRRSLFDAAPAARRFMPFPRTAKGLRRVCVHAELCFAEAVAGPVLLGAGRYYGLGMCRGRGR